MIAWLAGNMAWASIALLLVLLVRRPAARLFGAGPAYALWLLPVARLIMPPLPPLGADLFSIGPALEIIVSTPDTAALSPPPGGPGQWVPWLLAIWAGGAAVFLVRQWLGYRRFLTGLSLTSRCVGDHAGLPVVESAAVRGPLALGLLDRRIVVPTDFESRYTPDERRLALEHEAVHHRRGDIWWNLAGLLFLAAHWFNPIAWIAFRAFREDQELACDAAVSARAGAGARHDYARALIKSASRPGLIAVCPLNHADQLKRRLRMMKHHRPSRLRMIGGSLAVAILAGVTATLGSPGAAHPHPEGETKSRTERVIIMTHKGDASAGDVENRLRIRRGDGEIVIPECDRSGFTHVDEGSGNERTRVVLCTEGNVSPAERAEQLERARDRIAADSELSADQRARVTAALDREIARLRGQ